MKKLFLLLTAFCLLTTSFAAFEIKHLSKKATEIFLPIGNDKKISLMDLSTIGVNDFENLTGRHLKFFDRLAFKGAQKKLRHSINSDGTVNKRLLNYMSDDEVTTWSKISWLIKGLLLGPLAVLIAYIFLKDDERELIKWAWFGFAGFLIIGAVYLFTL